MNLQESTPQAIRDHFLGWQCRIRQIAVRRDGGRPSAGMRPRVLSRSGEVLSAALTVLLVPEDPAEATALFRFQVQRTADPQQVYRHGLALLQADFFQLHRKFADHLTAVLPDGAPGPAELAAAEACVLEFSQYAQTYRLPATVDVLSDGDPARSFTLWHNRVFNPALPDGVRVVAFRPDWSAASAMPAPPVDRAHR